MNENVVPLLSFLQESISSQPFLFSLLRARSQSSSYACARKEKKKEREEIKDDPL